MLLQTFWYQIFENRTKIELSGSFSLKFSCKGKPPFAPPPPHYGNNPRKCVNYNLYLFLKLTIEFSNLTEIVNQQGTLRIVHRRVDTLFII